MDRTGNSWSPRPAAPLVVRERHNGGKTGYTVDEVVGQTPGLLQGTRTDPAVIDRLAEDLRHGRTFHGSTVNYKKDGTPFEIEWKVTAVTDDAGVAVHYLAVQRDISRA